MPKLCTHYGEWVIVEWDCNLGSLLLLFHFLSMSSVPIWHVDIVNLCQCLLKLYNIDILNFRIHLVKKKLYCGIVNHIYYSYSSLYLFIFYHSKVKVGREKPSDTDLI